VKVKELMTRQVVTAGPGMSLKEAARIMINHKISGLPVVDDSGHLIGVISEGDVVHQESIRRPGTNLTSLFRSNPRPALSVDEAMTTKVVAVGGDIDHAEAARIMETRNVKRLPVVDTDNRLIGLISRSDLLRAFGRPDEDVKDEVVTDVIKRILWLDHGGVDVAVVDGEVSLRGTVPTRSDARILEEMTRRLDGVVRVDVSDLRFDVDDSRRADTPLSGGLGTPDW